ncbi:F-type H+-transporting ATPase subunit b [Phycisphaerales bacterium]|nr:F-type H+-transporting ATPase subunit b [Phycisphaerales bacterium]
MNRLMNSFVAAASLLTPLAALAQEGHEAASAAGHSAEAHAAPSAAPISGIAEGVATGLTALIVFALVFAVIAVKIWPTIAKGLDDRANKIREEIEAAEMARQQAKDALEEYQKSLADARAEAQKMIDAARQQQTALAAELKAQSDADLAALRDRARRDIETAKRTAVAEIYSEAANLGTMIASKILKRNVSGADTQSLVDESVKQLAAMKN